MVENIGQVSRWKHIYLKELRILFIHLKVCVDDGNFIFTIKIAYISKQSEMRGS